MATPTSLPASFAAADVLTAANMNLLRGAFRVLQVVTATSATITTSSTTTQVNTGLSCSITPQFSSSKIAIFGSQNFEKTSADANNAVISKLYRDATVLTTLTNYGLHTGTALGLVGLPSSFLWLDSPTTTSAVTYKTMFNNLVAAATVRFNPVNAESVMILAEISA